MKRWTILVTALALAACGGRPGTDGGADARPGDGGGDARFDGMTSTDSGDGDDATVDDDGSVTPPGDGGDTGTVTPPADGGDGGMNVTDVLDVTTGGDTGVVTPPRDAGDVTVTPPPDSGMQDVVITPPPDTGPGACPVTVAVTAPTEGGNVESCTKTGQKVYYNFQANIAGATSRVEFRFQHPQGAEVQPSATDLASPYNVTISGSQYTARRQVGGPWSPGEEVPLSAYGQRGNAIGVWTLRVRAQHTSGCVVEATRMFNLTYESRARDCPNP